MSLQTVSDDGQCRVDHLLILAAVAGAMHCDSGQR